MTAATTNKLICFECQHENEGERIFCHNCGERLDRSSASVLKKVEDPTEVHRRLQKMMQGPSRTRQNFFVGCKLLLAAAITAVVVQMLLPPDFPAAMKDVSPAQLDLALENAVYKPAVLTYSQQDVNAYLVYRLKTKKKVLDKPLLDWARAAVVFKEGSCLIGWERSIFGYSIYSQISFQTGLNRGKITATTTGGWIGRLPIHPGLMRYVDVIFADLWSALDRERKLVSKMSAVEFHDGSVTITSGAH